MLQESATEEDSDCDIGRATADSAVDGHGPSSWECPTAMSMPVLMGDNWPFNGCRTVAEVTEDAVDVDAGAGAGAETVVLCAIEAGCIW